MSDSTDENAKPFLTEEQRKRLQGWVSENLPYGQCPWCHGMEWQTGETVVLPPYFAGGAELVVLPLTCAQCAYIRFFSARQMGYVV